MKKSHKIPLQRESPLDNKEIKPVNLKGNQPWILVGVMLKLKVQYSGHLMRTADSVPDAGKEWGQKEKRVSEDEMAGRHHQWKGHEPGQTLVDGEGQGGLACCNPWGSKELDTTGSQQQSIHNVWRSAFWTSPHVSYMNVIIFCLLFRNLGHLDKSPCETKDNFHFGS